MASFNLLSVCQAVVTVQNQKEVEIAKILFDKLSEVNVCPTAILHRSHSFKT